MQIQMRRDKVGIKKKEQIENLKKRLLKKS